MSVTQTSRALVFDIPYHLPVAIARPALIRLRASMGHAWRVGVAILVGVAVITLATPAAGAEESGSPPSIGTATTLPALIDPTFSTDEDVSAEPLERVRTVTINFSALAPDGTLPGDRLRFNLFKDADFPGVVRRVERRIPDRFTLSGRLEGNQGGTFVLVRRGQTVAADLHLASGQTYEIRGNGFGSHTVREVNEDLLAPCVTGPGQGKEAIEGAEPQNQLAGAGGGVTPSLSQPASLLEPRAAGTMTSIDVMIVYTPEARAAGGGHDEMAALAELFVANANEAYRNSGIPTGIRLVYAGEVSYVESRNASTDLDRLTKKSDGYLDDVHRLRDAYGADMVTLLVNQFSACGIAWLHYGERYAFSVVDFGCGSKTYIHELGHNMGCAHDRNNASVPGEFPYSYGHRFQGLSGKEWRTIMAYFPGTRILHLSNPNVPYDGAPTGVFEWMSDAADNASTVNATASTIESYRPAADLTDCNGNFRPDEDDLAEGTSEDCNGNGVPDECDAASGRSADANANGLPDECECDPSACDDADPCTIDGCDPSNGACTHVSGAIPYGDTNSDGMVDVDDVLCVLRSYADFTVCPSGDLWPCGGNGRVELDDILAVLHAMSGTAQCPGPCDL